VVAVSLAGIGAIFLLTAFFGSWLSRSIRNRERAL
jgi:hypothetical protein